MTEDERAEHMKKRGEKAKANHKKRVESTTEAEKEKNRLEWRNAKK